MSKQQYIEELFNTMTQLKKLLQNQTTESHEEKIATMMQYSALMYIKNNKNNTVGDLAAFLSLSKSSATQLIERLSKMNMLERTDDKDDRRVVRLNITKNGEDQLIYLKSRFIEKIGKVFSRIPEKDLKELIRIHTELINSFQ